MKNYEAVHSITALRDGKVVTIAPGTVAAFSDEEVTDLLRLGAIKAPKIVPVSITHLPAEAKKPGGKKGKAKDAEPQKPEADETVQGAGGEDTVEGAGAGAQDPAADGEDAVEGAGAGAQDPAADGEETFG